MDTSIETIDAPGRPATGSPQTANGDAQTRLTWHRAFVPIGLFLAGFGIFNWAELPRSRTSWAEDRAELQEQTVYFVVFTQLLAIVLVVSLAEHVARWLRSARGEPA